MTRGPDSRSTRPMMLVLMLVLALSGCREDEDDTLPALGDAAAGAAPGASWAAPGGEWLEPTEDEPPLVFIARVTGAPQDEVAPHLQHAADVYRESPRMIANRAVQLWDEIGRKDDVPVDIVTLLAQLAPGGDTPGHSIGPVIQHYRVLRGQGADHAAAMAGAVRQDAAP